jgi:predicted PurR-regulated permease PerM
MFLYPEMENFIQSRLTKLLKSSLLILATLAGWNHFTDNIQTREYNSPETILSITNQASLQIWPFASHIFEVLTLSFLFKTQKDETNNKDND